MGVLWRSAMDTLQTRKGGWGVEKREKTGGGLSRRGEKIKKKERLASSPQSLAIFLSFLAPHPPPIICLPCRLTVNQCTLFSCWISCCHSLLLVATLSPLASILFIRHLRSGKIADVHPSQVMLSRSSQNK